METDLEFDLIKHNIEQADHYGWLLITIGMTYLMSIQKYFGSKDEIQNIWT